MTDVKLDIDLGGVDKMLDRLNQSHGLKLGLSAAIRHVRGPVSAYPPAQFPQNRPSRESVYGTAFVSDAQRRYVFGAIKRGEIPYVRGISASSERMGQRWANESRRGGLEQVLGNNASYANDVIGDNQSRYMAALGWRPVREVMEEETPAAVRIIESFIKRDVDGK